ncbi:MAG: ribonuclease H [Polyangiaceae bacterium]
MPWIEARLRGQRVLARAKADGTLLDEGGRVEIRYRNTDARAYRAAARNLQLSGGALLPDDHCVPAEAVPSRDEGGKDASAKPAAKKAKPAAAPAAPPGKDAWIAYTDGACTGNPGPAGAGFIVIEPGGKIAEGFESLGIGTNNVAELTAILRAAEAIPRDAPEVVIHTDSKYAIGVLGQNWKAKANQALIAQTKSVLAEHQHVRFVYVPGHAGVPLNERADELAREAIKTARNRPLGAG